MSDDREAPDSNPKWHRFKEGATKAAQWGVLVLSVLDFEADVPAVTNGDPEKVAKIYAQRENISIPRNLFSKFEWVKGKGLPFRDQQFMFVAIRFWRFTAPLEVGELEAEVALLPEDERPPFLRDSFLANGHCRALASRWGRTEDEKIEAYFRAFPDALTR